MPKAYVSITRNTIMDDSFGRFKENGMSMDRSIATFLAMVLFAAPAWAQMQFPKQIPASPSPARGTRTPESSSAPAAAARFWEIGYELAHAPNITGPEADQAIILLTAAKSLNSQIVGVEPLLLRLAARHSEKDYSEPVIFWLQKYVNESADRTIVADAIRYLENRSISLEQRKALLERVTDKIRNKNLAIDSELATSLGLLMLERKDLDPAKHYLVQAYKNNPFNRVAFAKLAELVPNEIGPATHLEHLRLVLRENPLDLDGALAFAGYAERLQLYDVAAQSYQYCAELFRYLYPSELLPPHIYLPWAISCYNTPQGLPICGQIAENIRNLKRFDILLEAIAGKAALKMGRAEEARRIFQQAEQKAQELLLVGQGQLQASGPGGAEPVRSATAKQLAWFYCFADPVPAKALDWANRAFSAEPNSPAAAALLAYAFTISNQLEWAKPLLTTAEQNQIVDLVQARAQLAAGNKPDAILAVKAAIARDASSLVAEKAKELLRELGSEYVPPVDTRALVDFLAERLGKGFIPQFTPPDKMIDLRFGVRGTDFSYGNEIEGAVVITNKASEPLVITENSLFQGNIRVTARITGDIAKEIPNLISETIRTDLIVPPGKSLVHPVRLSTGELRELLLALPQASLDIQFTLYLDPVTTDNGAVSSRLVDVKPVTASIKRPRAAITGDLVRSRVNAIASSPEAQKLQMTRLVAGLLKEQRIMSEKGALYEFHYMEWLWGLWHAALVKPSGLLLGGTEDQWAVKVSTMADMFSVPLDQELANVLAKNLTQGRWPVRLMAVYLLAKSPTGSFGSVLDWVAQNDTDELVRSMAASLQSASSFATTPRLPAFQSSPATLP